MARTRRPLGGGGAAARAGGLECMIPKSGNRFSEKIMHRRLVGVAGRDLASDLGAFGQVAADGKVGRRRAGAIALLEGPIAAVEACDHLFVALPARRLGVDEHSRLVAPFLPLV